MIACRGAWGRRLGYCWLATWARCDLSNKEIQDTCSEMQSQFLHLRPISKCCLQPEQSGRCVIRWPTSAIKLRSGGYKRLRPLASWPPPPSFLSGALPLHSAEHIFFYFNWPIVILQNTFLSPSLLTFNKCETSLPHFFYCSLFRKIRPEKGPWEEHSTPEPW